MPNTQPFSAVNVNRNQNRNRLILLTVGLVVVVIMIATTTSFDGQHLHPENENQDHHIANKKNQEEIPAGDVVIDDVVENEKDSKKTKKTSDDHHLQQEQKNTNGEPLVIEIDFSSQEFVQAWKTSSKRETHKTTVSCQNENFKESRVTFYGKSSLKISYTARRSIHVQIDDVDHGKGIPLAQFDKSLPRESETASKVTNFVLLSLWEDTYRLAYRSSAILLRKLGLFYPHSSLVEVRCKGSLASEICYSSNSSSDSASYFTLGVYLAIEYPSDAIERKLKEILLSHHHHHNQNEDSSSFPKLPNCFPSSPSYRIVVPQPEQQKFNEKKQKIKVATRNWFYFEKPANYDLLSVPSYKRDSPLSPIYREIENDPFAAVQSQHFLLDQYLVWLLVNTLLKNGDYDDEVFFWGISNPKPVYSSEQETFSHVGIMAWDYDNVFSACHRKGRQAIRSNLMYCAETPIEKKILSGDARLKKRYEQIASCLLKTKTNDNGNLLSLAQDAFDTSVDLAVSEFNVIINQQNGKYSKILLYATFHEPKVVSGHKKKATSSLKSDLVVVSKNSKISKGTGFVTGGASWLKSEFGKSRTVLLNILPDHDDVDEEKQVTLKHQDEKQETTGTKQDQKQEKEEIPLLQINSDEMKNQKNPKRCEKISSKLFKFLPANNNKLPEFKKQLPASILPQVENQEFSIQYQFGLFKPFADKQRNQLSLEGLHCVYYYYSQQQKDENSCLVSRPIVVRSSERGKAEFGVNHHNVLTLAQVYERENTEKQRDKDIKIILPKVWLSGENYQPSFPITFVKFSPMMMEQGHEDITSWNYEKDETKSVEKVSISFDHEEGESTETTKIQGFIIRGFGALLLNTPATKENLKKMPFPSASIPSSKAKISSVKFGSQSIQQKYLQLPRFIAHEELSNSEITTKIEKVDTEFVCSTPVCQIVPQQLSIATPQSSLTISAGSLLLLPELCTIVVLNGGKLSLLGTGESPVAVSSTASTTSWNSIHVKAGGNLLMKHAILTGSGLQREEKIIKLSEFKHHSHTPAILAESETAIVKIFNSVFVGLRGPAFAATNDAKIHIENSLVQFAELGGECVFCDFTSKRSLWSHFASTENHESNIESSFKSETTTVPYEDNDNDGLYLSGGIHIVEDSVIARTHDDGIDSGISEHRSKIQNNNNNIKRDVDEGKSLRVSRTIIEDVTHEGIAFSSTPSGRRQAVVQDSLIQRTQQALEMGYSGVKCNAEIRNTTLRNNQIGLRFGDNYYRRDQEGNIVCDGCTFDKNDVNVVNYVRKLGSPSKNSYNNVIIRNSKFGKAKIWNRSQFACFEVLEGFKGEGNSYV